MGLFKRKQQEPRRQRPESPKPAHEYTAPEPGLTEDGRALPGAAGYRGLDRLAKGALPISRFTYKRPDGKE